MQTHHLLLLPRPTSAPALRLRGRLGGARLRRRLFGPTVTHAWVCPPASESWASNPRRSCLESCEDKRARVSAAGHSRRKLFSFSVKTKSHFIVKQLEEWTQTGAQRIIKRGWTESLFFFPPASVGTARTRGLAPGWSEHKRETGKCWETWEWCPATKSSTDIHNSFCHPRWLSPALHCPPSALFQLLVFLNGLPSCCSSYKLCSAAQTKQKKYGHMSCTVLPWGKWAN